MSHGHEGGDSPLSAFFFFPCYPGDDGGRPLPSFVCSWRSPAILLDGKPHDGKVLDPGLTIQLSAVVANHGALSASALVTILWAPMSAQFAANLTIAAQFSDFWLAGETKTVGPTAWTVPPGMPGHVCLLAAVDSVLDPIPMPLPQSIADRHYAQCNLDFKVVAPGSSTAIPIVIGHGGRRGRRMQVRVRADLSQAAQDFARERLLHLDRELASAVRPVLESRALRRRAAGLAFEAREEDHDVMLLATMPPQARPGQAIILAVEQFADSGDEDHPELVGSVALVLVAGREG